jgi:hypothetical protein
LDAFKVQFPYTKPLMSGGEGGCIGEEIKLGGSNVVADDGGGGDGGGGEGGGGFGGASPLVVSPLVVSPLPKLLISDSPLSISPVISSGDSDGGK